jgi:hypothetical protein
MSNIRYDRQWARDASSEELITVVSDTPTSCEPTVDWRAIAAELGYRLEKVDLNYRALLGDVHNAGVDD